MCIMNIEEPNKQIKTVELNNNFFDNESDDNDNNNDDEIYYDEEFENNLDLEFSIFEHELPNDEVLFLNLFDDYNKLNYFLEKEITEEEYNKNKFKTIYLIRNIIINSNNFFVRCKIDFKILKKEHELEFNEIIEIIKNLKLNNNNNIDEENEEEILILFKNFLNKYYTCYN